MSDQSMELLVVLVLLFVHSLACPNGVEGGTGLSEEECLEIENQLELLNKPAVKTIYSDYGDTIDCVDFYKQPAFDHPLLKNHTFHYQMKPASSPRRERDLVESKSTKPISMGLRGGGCPVGTVPIRRITKEDLIRERLASKTMSLAGNGPNTHYAVIRTTSSSTKFNGAGAYISLHNPHVEGVQYSAARVKIQNGDDSIEAGWRVDPFLYGDNRTRLFIHFNAGKSYCYNTRCAGFVIVRSDIPLDGVFPKVSIPGQDPITFQAYVNRDEVSGNWWLELGNERTAVGFWPKVIFSGLGDLANYVEWGGQAFSLPRTNAPPMGGGSFPIGNTAFDGFFLQVKVLNEYGKTVNVDNAEEFADNENLYKVWDQGYQGDHFGRIFLYGGPGGKA